MFGLKINVVIKKPSPALAEKIADDLAEYLVASAKTTAPVRTGALRDSIHVDRSKSGSSGFGEATRVVAASVKYAEVVEFGRKKFAPFPGRYYMKKALEMLKEYLRTYLDDFIDSFFAAYQRDY
jgi:hypothetical protein